MKNIDVYHTHVEIYPYEPSELPNIEKMFSVWDEPTFSYNPIGLEIHNDKLYLPRGANLSVLSKSIRGANIKTIKECDPFDKLPIYGMKYPPRDIIQEESCNFLIGEDKFKYTRKASQLSLNLDTGDGKTYCAVKSILDLRMKAIIITHADKIKTQWIDTCTDMTNIPEERLINITGTSVVKKILDGSIEGDIYFINHQTINAYFRNNGYDALREFFNKLQVGIKVCDEAHLSFKNIIRIDMFSNVKKSFYLTANFSRSDVNEKRLFDRAFSQVMKFGEQTKDYDCKRKHIVYIPVFYNSRASQEDIASMRNYYGFSSNAFIDYAIDRDTSSSLEEKLLEIYNKTKSIDGKILITSPKTSSVDYIANLIKKEDSDVIVGTIYSKNSEEVNENSKQNCDVISSTLKSCGTGADIPGLRIVINTEPYSSNITANQLAGRLREYSETEDTYYFDLVDISIPRCYEMYKTRLKFLKGKCKKIVMYDK